MTDKALEAMTAPLNEKGYDASIQALLNAFPLADKTAAMYAEVAIRAYLAASPSPSEMEVRFPHSGMTTAEAVALIDSNTIAGLRIKLEAAEARMKDTMGLLDHLVDWIVHDCGAEVPFSGEQDETYTALKGDHHD